MTTFRYDRLLAAGLLALAAIATPATSEASAATTAKDVNLRAGPARDYPVVAVLQAGLEVDVQGCVDAYTWCDVVYDGLRGWVWAGNLLGDLDGAPVPIYGYGSRIGIVVVPFVLLDYWSLHYIDRPWYRDRDRWSRHRPPPPIWHRPPPPDGHRPPPPPPTDRHRPSPPREVPHRPPPGSIAPTPPHGPAPPPRDATPPPSPPPRGTAPPSPAPPRGDVPQRHRPTPVSPGASAR